MKLHKIPGIDKNICTCEQKVAYNYAFMWWDSLEKIYKSDASEAVKSEAYQDIINYVISSLKEHETDKKYNIDTIIHCFRNGIKNYMEGFSVLWNYEDIGKTFPCLYENN